MIDLKLVIYIVIASVSIVGSIVTFFVMQKEQNMKIKALEKALEKLEKKQTDSTSRSIETEKVVREINVKLEHIEAMITELKNGKGTQ